MPQQNFYNALYVLSALLCVGISAYLSYWGYYNHLKGLTLMFAALLAILLFASDLLVRQYRIARKSLIFPLFFFVLVASFSWASNFNYLYFNFMSDDIVERTVQEKFQEFRSDLTNTKSELSSLPSVNQNVTLKNKVERELLSLREQMDDPLRPGCGERCRIHVENIYELLGGQPTDLAIPSPGAPASVNNNWYQNFRNAVLGDLEKSSSANASRDIKSLIDDIDSLLGEYRNSDKYLRQSLGTDSVELITGQSLPVLKELRSNSLEIERRANAILPQEKQVAHADLSTDLDKIGEIPISLKDAFIERPNPGVSIISALLALFVDVIPIIFALVLYGAGFGPSSNEGKKGRKRKTSRVVNY